MDLERELVCVSFKILHCYFSEVSRRDPERTMPVCLAHATNAIPNLFLSTSSKTDDGVYFLEDFGASFLLVAAVDGETM